MVEFEPVIIGFVCNECVYAAADLAGTSRLNYPSNVRLIRVPCSGQVDMIHILRAFENGADGVFVGGCLKEQCHYVDGNFRAEDRVGFLQDILKDMGFEKERLGICFMSAAMGHEFAKFADEFTETIEKLGPSPLKKQKKSNLDLGKRDMLHDMLLSISSGLKTKNARYNQVFPGFGGVEINQEKCFGCGACAYVCKDGALAVGTKGNRILINNIYWKCTACGNCKEACPKECLEVKSEFDLQRFLEDKEEVLAQVGMMSCTRCGTNFLPLMLANDIERVLKDMSQSSEYVGLCPVCRKFYSAEKMKAVLSLSYEDKENWKLRRDNRK